MKFSLKRESAICRADNDLRNIISEKTPIVNHLFSMDFSLYYIL